MSDPFIQIVKTTLVNLGYNTRISAMGAVKEWDTLPCVCIIPLDRSVKYHAMPGKKNIINKYQIVYVSQNNLDYSQTDVVYDFKLAVIDAFMPTNADLLTAGAWYSKIYDDYDFRKDYLPQGYNYAAISLHVNFIENP